VDFGGVFVPDGTETSLNLAAGGRSIAAGRRFDAIAQTCGSS
jgi:hypothetical protein